MVESKGLNGALKVGVGFALWYILNIGYNITNKKALNISPGLAWTVALVQFFIGWFYAVPMWLLRLRKIPELTKDEVTNLLPMAFFHALTHIGGVVSCGAGAVSFSHIIKASEPAFSAAMSAVCLKSYLPMRVYLTLLLVMGGVALASLGELSFSWKALSFALISSLSSASRGILGKKNMVSSIGKNMDPKSLYAVMTILATIILLPATMAIEGKVIVPTVKAIFKAGQGMEWVIQTVLSAIFYYLYNEVAFLCLDAVDPVTHALGNTIKRVVVIVASVVAFGTVMTRQGIVGSVMALSGVLMYSLARQNFVAK
jgi:solute carrier family 35 protein E1